MTSVYHTHARSQDRPAPPPGYTERQSRRAALHSFDPAEIIRAETRGASLPAQPVGGASGACYKVHISPNPHEREKKHTDKTVAYFTAASCTAQLGSPKADTGEICWIDSYRTSAIIGRLIQNPRPNRLHRKKLSIQGIDDVVKASQAYAEKNDLDPLTEEQILTAFDGQTRGKIDSFTRKSKAKLKFTAANCFPNLVSQFCLTYGDTVVPANGRVTKNHLDRFLKDIRKRFPHVAYLWILEFQTKRGAVHYHIFFSFPVNAEIHAFLARTWVRITGATGEEEQKMLRVHLNPKNFIPWDMKKGGYLTKYIDKESQKHVPANFQDVGRFWASSRNLVPPPERIYMEQPFLEISHTDKITGETIPTDTARDLYRILKNHHEASLRQCGIKRKSRLRDQGRTITHLPSGGLVTSQYFQWKDREEFKMSGLDPGKIPF